MLKSIGFVIENENLIRMSLDGYIPQTKDWKGIKIKTIRNRCGRLHWIWIKDGKSYEFYAQGRASKPYWQNLLYFGEVREVKYPNKEKL